MLTEEIRDALRTAADTQPFAPDLTTLPARVRRMRRRRTLTVAGSAGLVIALVATLVVVAVGGGRDRVGPPPAGPSKAEAVTAEVENWGPARGNLADDTAFLDHVEQEWLHPPGYYYGADRGLMRTSDDGTKIIVYPEHRHLTGDVRFLYAGQTADGPAAIVAQRTTDKDIGYYFGILLPTGQDDLRLVAAYTASMYSQSEIGDRGFDTHMISFKTRANGGVAVVLPANPEDTVTVSTSHTLDADGRVQRSWAPLPTPGGVGTLTAEGRIGLWDTLVRVHHNGETVDEATVWKVADETSPDPQPPTPANFVPPFANGDIGGSVPGGGFPGTLDDPWLATYGALSNPYGSTWLATGSPADEHPVIAAQMWFYGDPAHTVVMRVVGKSVQILSDTITDPTARPLVFMQLPEDQGWLVVGGPHTHITGYREPGQQQWTDAPTSTAGTVDGKPVTTNTSVFVPSTADHLEVRMTVNGEQRTASR